MRMTGIVRPILHTKGKSGFILSGQRSALCEHQGSTTCLTTSMPAFAIWNIAPASQTKPKIFAYLPHPFSLLFPMRLLIPALLFLCFTLLSQAMEVVSKNGNIYLKPEKGALIQLTNSGRDSDPCLSHNGKQIAFVRDTPGALIDTGSGEQNATELWLMDVETRKTELLAKGKASDDMKKVLACFNAPCFSLYDKAVYFLSAAWATSSSVHRVTLAAKKVDFITDGNSISVIKQGQHAGSILIDRALLKYDKHGAQFLSVAVCA